MGADNAASLLAGTGLTVRGLITGHQSTKARTDQKTGVVSDPKHYLFLACENADSVKVKMLREPDPEVYPIGTIKEVRVTLTSFGNNIYYSQVG